MDPTAQDNNQKEDQNPVNAAGKPPQNPILPGQYVVAQDETSHGNQQFAPPPPLPPEPAPPPPPPPPPPSPPPGAPPPNFEQPDPTPFNASPAQNQMTQPPAG